MRNFVLFGLLLAVSFGAGCRGGRLGCFRGAPCRSGCGPALPPPPAQASPSGCNTCGPVSSGYGSYDSGVIGESVVGGDYYGGEVISGDYYGGTETIVPSAPSAGGNITPPMSSITPAN